MIKKILAVSKKLTFKYCSLSKYYLNIFELSIVCDCDKIYRIVLFSLYLHESN